MSTAVVAAVIAWIIMALIGRTGWLHGQSMPQAASPPPFEPTVDDGGRGGVSLASIVASLAIILGTTIAWLLYPLSYAFAAGNHIVPAWIVLYVAITVAFGAGVYAVCAVGGNRSVRKGG